MNTGSPHRVVWAFAAGYFLAYAPYCAMVRMLTGGPSPPAGLVLLPAVITGTVLGAVAGITLLGWWTYWKRPSVEVILSGLSAAVIIATTTLAYTFAGISIVFALLLLRGGVLILAPLADLAFHRPVRWFSWAAFALSIGAVAVTVSEVAHDRLTIAAVLNIGAYLFGYVVRIPAMTYLAKRDDENMTRTYFVQELVVAMAFLLVIPALLAVGGNEPLRQGFAVLGGGALLAPALLIGLLYSALYFCGTRIYLDKRENTFCIPLNRGSSLLAGIFVSMSGVGLPFPSISQFVAASMIVLALMLLSPAHHIFEWRPVRQPRVIGEP